MDQEFLSSFQEVEAAHWWFGVRRDLVLGLLEPRMPASGRLLDLGAGTGFFLEAAAERWEVWGIEPSRVAVDACLSRGLRRVIQGTIEESPKLLSGGFDAVTLLDVIEHLDDDCDALRTAWTLVRPGGTLVVTVPAYPWLWSGHDEVNGHRRRYTRASLRTALAKAGLPSGRITFFNGILLPIAIAARLGSRVARRPAPARLAVPHPLVNSICRTLFGLEAPLMAGRNPLGLPAGLSLLAILERDPGEPVDG